MSRLAITAAIFSLSAILDSSDMDYYNNERLQRNLGILTPMEKHQIYYAA